MELIAGNPAEPRTGGAEPGMPERAGRSGAPRGDLADRARGSLLGLAVGDALGAPAENLRPSEIRRRWGRIEGFVSDDPAGTDDTEYAIFSGLLLARHGSALTVTHVERAWHLWIADLDEGPFRGPGSASGERWRICAGGSPPRSPPSTGTPGATAWRCGRHRSASSRAGQAGRGGAAGRGGRAGQP